MLEVGVRREETLLDYARATYRATRLMRIWYLCAMLSSEGLASLVTEETCAPKPLACCLGFACLLR
jgi:hypothetical protein